MVLPMTPQADFQAAVLDKLRRAPLEPAAQKALLEVLIAAARPAEQHHETDHQIRQAGQCAL
jgi:hypothetical protein